MTILGNKHHPHDPVWHVQLAVLAAVALQLALPDRFTVGTHYVIPGIELLLVLALLLTTPRERIFRSLKRRVNALLLIGLISAANGYALVHVANQLLQSSVSDGRGLIIAALNIYLTNIIIFALWYWEMDGGGPGQRHALKRYELDFSFPQQQSEEISHPLWKPTFADYLYVSSTNAMAFSPTDTMPLTRRAKMLMLAQSVVSLVAIALVAARAVNIVG
jgi:uncharacterized membrane protein